MHGVLLCQWQGMLLALSIWGECQAVARNVGTVLLSELIPSTMPTVVPLWDATCDKYEKRLFCTPGFAFSISRVLLPTSCPALPPLVLLWATRHFADEYSPYWWCSGHCMTFGVGSTAVKSPVLLLLSCSPLRKLSNLSELKLLLQRRSLMASCLSWILFGL